MVQSIWEDGGAAHGPGQHAAGNFISRRTEDLSSRGFDAIATPCCTAPSTRPTRSASAGIAGGHKARSCRSSVTWVWTGSPFVVAFRDGQGGRARHDPSARRRGWSLRNSSQFDRTGNLFTEGADKRLAPGATPRGQRGGQPDEALGTDARAPESRRLPHGRRLRMAHRPDHRPRRRRLARQWRFLHRAVPLGRRRMATGARGDQGADRKRTRQQRSS